MLTQGFSVVRAKDDERVIQVAFAFHGFEQLTQRLVDHGHVGHVVGTEPAQLFAFWFKRPEYGVVVNFAVVHALGFQERGQVIQVAGLWVWHGQVRVVQIVLCVAGHRVIGGVRAEKTDLHEERLRLGPRL